MLVDSHAHLNFPELLSDIDDVLARAKKANVEKIINIGTTLLDSKMAIGLAQKYDGLYATVGVHPNDDLDATVDNVDWVEFEKLAKEPKVVAIGECGLDFSRIPEIQKSRQEEAERQRKLFEEQIEIAARLNLPLSIHIRDAQDDILQLFSETLSPNCGVFHCFSGNKEYLDWILRLLPSFYVSFAGNVTFKNAENLRELAGSVPAGRLLVETDCPYLSPEPHRGSRNEPANVKITATALAEVKNTSFEQLSNITTANAIKLFGLG